jgi:hypothetical protein
MSDTVNTPDPKTKEDWLRQELRANRTLMTGLLQWGVGIIAAVQLNLYYLRMAVVKHLVELKQLQPDELLPLPRWAMGTLFLVLLAYIFSSYMRRLVDRHVIYRTQLQSMSPSYSGIEEKLPIGNLSRIHYLLFYAFPVLDLVSWALFYAQWIKI